MNPPIRLVFPALLLLAAALTPSIQAQSGPPRTALLLGVGDYDGATYKGRKIQDLPGITTADLPKMKAKLEDLGFAVTVVADPSLSEAKTAVDTFAARIKTNPGVSLFYFSGHGGEHEGKNYLIPSGASIGTVADLADEALSAQRVLNGMEASGATVNLVFLDCCREDLGKSVGGAEMAPLKARGSFIGFATRSGDFADPEEEGSPYTRFLLKHLGTPGLSVPDMYGFVAEDVKDYSKRVLGEERTPGYYSELAGAPFYLVPGRAAVPDPSGTPPGNAAEMAALLARVEAAEKAKEEAERRAAMAASVPAAPMALTTPVTAPAFPASRGMEGSRAGEVRELGGIEMVWCPPGEFVMGSPASEEGRDEDETQHGVKLTRGFWLAKTETTQGQWESVMGTDVAALKASGVKDQTFGEVNATGRDVAMYFTNWEDAQAYLAKLNGNNPLPAGWKWDLPTEAQWEYACRAGTETATYYGALSIKGKNNAPALDPIAWYGGNSSVGYTDKGLDTSGWEEKQYPGGTAGAREVGLKKANDWGLHDMHGNVFEWCRDWYGDYPSGVATNPTGATTGSHRVVRGGSWFNYAAYCRSANRYWFTPDNRSDLLGFRVAAVPAGR
jgi:formylglycine-generating enzyme required for sulfatase activity